MELEELISLLKEYNFIENSVRSLPKKYKISEKKILKYLREYNIPYKNKMIKIYVPKDKYRRYTFKIEGKCKKNFQNNNTKSMINTKAMTYPEKVEFILSQCKWLLITNFRSLICK